MIVFDLCCGGNHVFEGWFGSSEDYETQKSRGLLECPLCGSHEVGKIISAVNVGAKGNQKQAPAAPVQVAHGDGTPQAEMRAMMEKLASLQREIEASHEDLGERFVEEARAMHHGEIDERPIRGDATLADAQALHEEGISILPLPFQRRKRLDA